MPVTTVVACVCNGRIVYGHAGDAPALPLLFIVPAVLLALGVGVWLTVRRGPRSARQVGSAPATADAVETSHSRPPPLVGSGA